LVEVLECRWAPDNPWFDDLVWGTGYCGYSPIFDIYGCPYEVPVNFSGTCTSEITAGCELEIVGPTLVGESVCESTATGDLSIYPALSGTNNCMFASWGFLEDMSLKGTIHAQSIVTVGSFVLSLPVYGSTSGFSSATGILEFVPYTELIAGPCVSGTSASGTLTDDVVLLTGLSTTVSTAEGVLTGNIIDLSGGAVCESEGHGVLTGIIVSLSGQCSCQSPAAGSLSGIVVWVWGSIVAQSKIWYAPLTIYHFGMPVIWRFLTGTFSSSTEINGLLRCSRELTSTIETGCNISSLLKNTKGLASVVTSNSIVAGTLTNQVFVVSTIITSSSIASSLTILWKLVGTITSTSIITSKLSMDLVGRVSTVSSITSTLKVTRELAGTITFQSNIVSTLIGFRSLVGTIAAEATVAGTPCVLRKLTGQISCSSTVTGGIVPIKMLVGSIVAHGSVTCGYYLTIKKKVKVTISTQSGINGVLKCNKLFATTLTIESALTASLVTEVRVVGSVSSTCSITSHLLLLVGLRVVVTVNSSVSGVSRIGRKLVSEIVAISTVNGNLIWRMPTFIVADVVILPLFEQVTTVLLPFVGENVNLPLLDHTIETLPVFTGLVTSLPIFVHATRVNERLKEQVQVCV